jgi:DNA-binding transcriptional ArsR family regulator
MVDGSVLDGVYRALADSSRRAIVERLAQQGEARVTDLAAQFPMSLNAVSKHVKVLERAGLVRRQVRGREHWLSLEPEPLERAWSWIGLYRRFWESRLDSLERDQRGIDLLSPARHVLDLTPEGRDA